MKTVMTGTKYFLYKEDFNKFLKALTEAVDYVKTDLMPDFDFDAYNHDQPAEQEAHASENGVSAAPVVDSAPIAEIKLPDPIEPEGHTEEVDKW